MDLRAIASRRTAARMTAVIAVGITTTAGIAAQSAGAATTGQPPTVSTQYTPNQIGVGQTAGITYTITDPNSSGTLYQISFTDTLPSTSAVDNPASVADSGCGSSIAVNATPGAGEVSASAITVKAGTPCTISVAIIGNVAGTASDAYSDFLYAASAAGYAIPGPVPTSDESPASLQVIGAPTITVKVPKNNAVYSYGEVVKASYSCTAGAGDQQSQLTCTAFDDLGNTINSGQDLDTKVPGQHQLDIQAISGLTSDTTDVTVNYTVLPDNRFTISKLKRGSGGALSFQLALPGAGSVVVLETASGKTIDRDRLSVSRERTLKVTLPANSTSKVNLEVSYKPKGGVTRTVTKRNIALG